MGFNNDENITLQNYETVLDCIITPDITHYDVVQMLIGGVFKVDSSSALRQLCITRSPLCPLLSVLGWLVLFYSILFCTFIALNLCKADSKAQHQKSSLRNHLSIAVAKSSTTETPDRVYAKVGMPCGRDMILTFS